MIGVDGEQIGIVSLDTAKEHAQRESLDLVEITSEVSPSVCRLLDYGKFMYRESKKKHEARARQKQVEVKEIKLRINISDGDYQVKLRNATRFLNEGNLVRVTIPFRGREVVFKDLGVQMIERFSQDVADIAESQQEPKLEKKRMSALLAPVSTKKKKQKSTENAKSKDE